MDHTLILQFIKYFFNQQYNFRDAAIFSVGHCGEQAGRNVSGQSHRYGIVVGSAADADKQGHNDDGSRMPGQTGYAAAGS